MSNQRERARRQRPSAINTPYSRYAVGGLSELDQQFLGWWERYSTESLQPLTSIEFTVPPAMAGRPDLIADKFFGRTSLTWLILQHNAIVDIVEEIVEGAVLQIPDPDRVKMGIASLRTVSR